MTETFPRTLIRFTATSGDPLYIQSVHYADGDGFKVKRVVFTRDRAKAARFHETTADAIARQYFTKVVATERVDGSLVHDYSEEFRPLAQKYFETERRIADEFNAGLRDAFAADAALLASIKSGGAK